MPELSSEPPSEPPSGLLSDTPAELVGPGAGPSVEQGDYLPFTDRPFQLRMGLRPLELDRWLEVDDLYAEQLKARRALIEERPTEVVGIVDRPEVLAASEELWRLVRAVAPCPAPDEGIHPVVLAGLSTQEDWCILIPSGEEYYLGAACVCFPSRWVLAEKMGSSNAMIHAPVAHYEAQLGAPVDSFLRRLSPDRPMWRLNWNLFDDPALFQPSRPLAAEPRTTAPISVADVGERVWLRVERQTLRKLADSGAIAFSIRVHQRPLHALLDRPAVLYRLRQAVLNLPEDTYRYKSLDAIGEQLIDWIDHNRSRSVEP